MKKTLFILSLLFSVQGAFSNDHAGYGNNIAEAVGITTEANTLPTAFTIDLDDNYILTGSMSVNGSHYSYMGFISKDGAIVGTVSGSFDVMMVNGLETIIDGSYTETFSDDDTADAVKAKHDSVRNALQNLR